MRAARPSAPALTVALCALLSCHAAAAREAWQGQVTPYAWGAGLGGRITPFEAGPSLRISKSFGDVLEDLDGALFVSAYARRDRLVLLGDLSHVASSKDGRLPPGLPAEGRLRQSSISLAAGWRVHAGPRAAVDLLGGLRYWSVQAAVDVPLAGLSRTPDARFVDPLLAARLNWTLAERWSLIAYADVGGFGAGSESTHQWLLAANYLRDARWAFSLGLRTLAVDYRERGARVDVQLSGPVLGLSWRF